MKISCRLFEQTNSNAVNTGDFIKLYKHMYISCVYQLNWQHHMQRATTIPLDCKSNLNYHNILNIRNEARKHDYIFQRKIFFYKQQRCGS